MIRGSYVALVTPFKNGKIDYSALERLLNFHIENETDGILLCGTTAEAPALSEKERKELISFCIKKIDKQLPVMVGTGSNNIDIAIKNTLEAQELGADFALIITPYYNKPTQEGMFSFFSEIEKKTNIDIVIYNVPGRTGVNISPETVVRLRKYSDRFIGIKEASGNIVSCSEIIRDCDDEFSLMSGDDALNFPILAVGGKGIISVTANIVPKLMAYQVELVEENEYFKARNIHLELQELHKNMFIETNPIPVKTALYKMKMIENEFRMPMCNLLKENDLRLENILKKYKLI